MDALSLLQNLTPMNIVLFVLLVVQTIMSESESIKASSFYGIFKTLLMTLVDQVKPKPTDQNKQ